MKLREQIQLASEIPLYDGEKERLEKIADDFAIGFAEWICDNYDNESIFLGIVDIKSLLIDYKKEKGL